MADWYYAREGLQRGPVSFETLQQMAIGGTLRPGDLVWTERMTDWTPASTQPGLFASESPAALGYAHPVDDGVLGYAQHHTYAQQLQYVGFWMRLVAWFIDYLILYIPNYAIQVAWRTLVLPVAFSTPASRTGARGFPGGLPPGFYMAAAGVWVLQVVVAWLYESLFVASKFQATPGKLALGLRVVDLNGNRLTFARSTGRHFAKALSGLLLGIGYLVIAFDARKRGMHDQICSTYVVRKTS